MVNDSLIKTHIEEIKKGCEQWLYLVNSLNMDAYFDRIVEEIIIKAKESEELHYSNRPE